MVKKAQELQPAEESALQNSAAVQEEIPAGMELSPKVSVIVLAHPGTEMLVKRIWEKHLRYHAQVDVLTFPENASLKALLADVIAAPEFENMFVLVPANLVPVATVTLDSLMVARVDVANDQKRYWGRVPVSFTKDSLVDFLPENEEKDDDDFVREYLEAQGVRPATVSHSFGNFYTKVLRGNPCENVVIEALIRKRFLYANQAGWSAIIGLLEKTLAE